MDFHVIKTNNVFKIKVLVFHQITKNIAATNLANAVGRVIKYFLKSDHNIVQLVTRIII